MSEPHFKIGKWTISPDELSLSVGEVKHQLPAKVFKVLIILAQKSGATLTRDDLIRDVWDGHTEVGTKGLNNAIYQLRKILKTDDDDGIKTIAKLGYQLTLPVEGMQQLDLDTKPEAKFKYIFYTFLAIAILSLFVFIKYPVKHEIVKYGKPKHITYYEGVEELPSISSNAQFMAFAWERKDQSSQIYVRSLVDNEAPLRQITFNQESETSPAFSPDGKQLAFIRSVDNGECSVLIKSLETLTETYIAKCHYKRYYRSVDWSASGRYLAYTRVTDKDTVAIYLYDFHTNRETQLTTPQKGASDIQLAWAKKDDRLVVVRDLNFNSNLMLYDIDGTEQTLIANESPIYGLAWAGDDQSIIFNALKEGDFSIWQYFLDEEKTVNIHRDSVPYNIDTIPNSNNAFVYARHESREYIGVYQLEGDQISDQAANEIHSSQRNMYAEYCPTEDKFVLISNRNGFFEIWSIRSDGSEAIQLTDKDGLIGLPSCSPTQSLFAFTLKPKGKNNHSLFVSDFKANQFRQLTNDKFEYQYPVWTSDGGSILISSNRGGEWNIWKYDLATGHFEQLTYSDANFAVMDQSHNTLYFTRENKKGLWKKNIHEDKELLIVSDLNVGDWGNFIIRNNHIYYVSRKEKDLIKKLNLTTGNIKILIEFDKNTIKGNHSITLGKNNQMIVTLLGPSEADILAVYPQLN